MALTALKSMLSWGEFTVKEAMQELDGLTGDQAKQVSEGRRRGDIVGLTEFQLKALDIFELRGSGLTGSHLRDKDWFNSANHVYALEHLLGRKGLKIDDAMIQLDGLSAEQVKLFVTEDILRDIIIKLTPMQIAILHNKYEYGFYGSNIELLDATWLKTPEHVELLKVLYRELHHSSTALAIVKDANDKDQVKETLEKIQNGWISGAALRFNVDYPSSKQQSASQSHSRSSGCNMM